GDLEGRATDAPSAASHDRLGLPADHVGRVQRGYGTQLAARGSRSPVSFRTAIPGLHESARRPGFRILRPACVLSSSPSYSSLPPWWPPRSLSRTPPST